jgi:hypothetical protein
VEPTAQPDTGVILGGRATSVPFTAVLTGPERTTTDNHEASSTCAIPILAGDNSGRTGFASRGSWVRVPSSPPTTAQVSAHEQRGALDPLASRAGVLFPGLAVVLDGLSAPDGTGTGCRHGTPWFVSQLGPRVLALAADPARSLVDALAEAIQQVASLHPGCDLKHPGTPSATMVLLRAREEGADYLALADAVLLLDT